MELIFASDVWATCSYHDKYAVGIVAVCVGLDVDLDVRVYVCGALSSKLTSGPWNQSYVNWINVIVEVSDKAPIRGKKLSE